MKRVPDINVIFKRRKFFKMWFVGRSGLISKTSLQQQQPSLPFSPSSATASRNLAISVMCFKWNVVEKKCLKCVSLPSTWSGRQGTYMYAIYPKIAGKLVLKIILPGNYNISSILHNFLLKNVQERWSTTFWGKQKNYNDDAVR